MGSVVANGHLLPYELNLIFSVLEEVMKSSWGVSIHWIGILD